MTAAMKYLGGMKMKAYVTDEDRAVMERALRMSAIDDEAAGMILEALILKKNVKISELAEEAAFFKNMVRQFESEGKDEGD